MSYFNQQYSRCRHCKFHYMEHSNFTGSVLGPVIRCGKTNRSAHDEECEYFEPKNRDWSDTDFSINSEWNLDKYKGLNLYGHE